MCLAWPASGIVWISNSSNTSEFHHLLRSFSGFSLTFLFPGILVLVGLGLPRHPPVFSPSNSTFHPALLQLWSSRWALEPFCVPESWLFCPHTQLFSPCSPSFFPLGVGRDYYFPARWLDTNMDNVCKELQLELVIDSACNYFLSRITVRPVCHHVGLSPGIFSGLSGVCIVCSYLFVSVYFHPVGQFLEDSKGGYVCCHWHALSEVPGMPRAQIFLVMYYRKRDKWVKEWTWHQRCWESLVRWMPRVSLTVVKAQDCESGMRPRRKEGLFYLDCVAWTVE